MLHLILDLIPRRRREMTKIAFDLVICVVCFFFLVCAGTQERDSAPPSRGRSLSGSFRKSVTGFSSDGSSCVSSASNSASCSRNSTRSLEEYSKILMDIDKFSGMLEDWVLENISTSSNAKNMAFKNPFVVDELRNLDYAREGVLFQQFFRMPYPQDSSDDCETENFLALEDFLQAILDGLWRTFWHKSGPLPFSISFPCLSRSRFYTLEKAISKGKLGGLCGAAIVARADANKKSRWEDIVEFALFKTSISQGNKVGLSSRSVCEGLFYGFHILLRRYSSQLNVVASSSIHILVLDSKFGGVVKLVGDLSQFVANSGDPYRAAVGWIKRHADVSVSPAERVWNKLGNANWGDMGALQLLLATYNSITQWRGPPTRTISSLAADHSLRLQKRRFECLELASVTRPDWNNPGRISEYGCGADGASGKPSLQPKFRRGDVILLEDFKCNRGFRIKDINLNCSQLSYYGVSLGRPYDLLKLYVGVHSSKLEPSWEVMSLWYVVQRQTKVLNIMKQHGVSCKYLPELVASGRISHPGRCEKVNPGAICDHPWCGTPILAVSPVGEPISSILAHHRCFSETEALKCSRDILASLRAASLANILHGDICPENVIRVDSSDSSGSDGFYVLVSWGHAVLEDRDSPVVNLQFSSAHALQHRKLCASSDVESLIYLLYVICGGEMQQEDSIESSLRWRERSWEKRIIQNQLGEASALLKAFADYVDSICGTPYAVDYDVWLRRFDVLLARSEKSKSSEFVGGGGGVSQRLEIFDESLARSGRW